ncbi:MAG: helix-turn-helix transcriptional regulator [Alphaproteobacteria bacterium]
MRRTDNITVTMSGFSEKPHVFHVPKAFGKKLENFIATHLEDEGFIPAEQVLPELADPVLGPAAVLRGSRYKAELTQKELAARLGIRQHHLSEMENGKRPIGKQMAKRLAEVLKSDYRHFI